MAAHVCQVRCISQCSTDADASQSRLSLRPPRSHVRCSGVLEEVTCGKNDRKLVVHGMRAGVKVLVQHLGAAVDARDQAGRTAVHWMVFTAISDYADDEVKFKPPDPRLQRGLMTAGVKPGPDELKEPFLVRQTTLPNLPAHTRTAARSVCSCHFIDVC